MRIASRCMKVAAILALFVSTNLSLAASVAYFSPQGEVKKVKQVTARFSEQMVAFGDPREVAPFDVDCPVKGKGRWDDQHNWSYDFEHDLPAGVACRLTVKNGLAALGGAPVEVDTYRFNTGGPKILQSEPYQGNYGIDENQIFILGLDAPATPESVQKHAWCTADGIPERIPVRVISGKFRASVLGWRDAFLSRYYRAIFGEGENERRSFVFSIDEKGTDREKFMKLRDGKNSPIVVLQCVRTFPNNTLVRLVWDKGIKSVFGAQASQVQTLSFRTRPVFKTEFSCSRVNEKSGCIPVVPMELNLSAPVTLDIAQRIRLVAVNGKSYAPVISGSEKKSGSVQWLHFPAPLPENMTFRIVLPKGFVDDAGRPPVNASSFPLEVRTDEHPPLAKFAARFGILELNATTPPLLPITLRNVEPSLVGNLTDPPIPGKALRANSDTLVIDWLSRLESIDSRYMPGTYTEDESRGPGKISIFGKEDGVKPFELPKPLGDKAFEVVGIPLPEPGFYVVEVASPRLGKALHEADRPYYAHAAVLVTNLAVHFKQGRESSLVWVTSLDNGKPAPNAEVTVRDCQGKPYFQGHSDASGLLKIDKELPRADKLPGCHNGYGHQYFVTARLGNDFSFVLSNWNEGISLWRFNAFQGAWQQRDILHAILDRTLLRAGETVHMKLVARRKTAGGFDRPEGKLPEAIAIQLQGADDKFTLPVGWDGNGTTVADWAVPQDAKQGVYVIQANDEEIGRFRVAEFRVPTMKAILQPPAQSLVNAEEAALNIQVNYLAGGGASRLPVRLRGRLMPKTVSFSDYEDFTFANGGVTPGIQKRSREPWNLGAYMVDEPGENATSASPDTGVMLATQELRLDAAGSARAAFAKLSSSVIPRNIEVELEYQDPNGETLTTATRIPLWPSRTIVGLKPDGWMATADHLKFQALVLGLDGKPRAGKQVVVKALTREYFSHRRRLIGGFYGFDNHSEINEAGELCKGVTDALGLLVCDVKSPASGNVILQAETRDADGNASIANREIWVAGDDWWFDASDNDRIDLLPEKKRYEPGEKARFQLRMPFKEADVLVTVEREGVLDSFVTHLTRDNPTIEVPLKGHYAPNVFVSALAVRGRINDAQPTALIDLGKPAFKMGLAEIRVGWAAHELKVRVATDKPTYRVREKAKVSIDVRSPDGSIPPQGTEIALAAVDEGLLELKPNESWKLLEAMMQRRGIEVGTSTAQMQVIGKRHFGRKALPTGGGGGASPSRELFDTLLFWQARVRLDANGHAEVEVPLNDSLTSFRIVAVANGMDQFGADAASINSTQDLMLFSGLPPVVREQDRFHAGFTVRNGGDHAVEAVVAAKASVLGKVAGDLAPITLKLSPGESRNVGWDVSVPLDAEALKWEVFVREQGGGEDGDRIKVSQKVIAAVPVRTLQATIMQLESPQSIAVRLPDGAIPGRGGVRVTFRKRLGDGLEGVAEFMARYPYTCMEQLASQAVALQDEARWHALMKKLPAYLDGNGLVKYFPTMQDGDDTLTAYLLAIADEAGYEIPDETRDRMRTGLRGFVEGRVIRYSALPTSDLAVRKLAAIEALSRSGDADRRWLDSIEIAPNLWPTSAVLDWLSILQRSPGISAQADRLAEGARQIVRSRLNFQGATMGFSTERNDALWWLMTNGDVNANRVLLTLLDRPDWKPDMPRLVRGALGRQQRGHWNTTVANAWGVLAMKKFSAAFERAPVEGTTTAELGKSRLYAEWRDGPKEAQQLLDWPASTAPVKLAHDGKGKPWATLQSLAASPLKEPLFTGYRIIRKVFPVSQKAKGEWRKGDVARVRIEVEAQSDMAWVVVNDPIPSGASILGTGLGGDSKLMTRGEKKQGWVWPAFEERTFDSFRAYYRFVPKGKFAVEYTVRLNNDGEFKLPGTRVEAMYAPEMFGERPNGGVTVRP